MNRPHQWQNCRIKTLALVLVVLLCQLFGDNNFFTVHYPDADHPLGVQVQHTHDQHEHHCDCCPTEAQDHEHADHVHCSCHPPQGEYVALLMPQDKAVPAAMTHYRSLGYAPPIPPPNA